MVRWKWKNDIVPELTNKKCCYDNGIRDKQREEFEKELDRWVAEGIFLPWVDDFRRIIALMAVEQPTKGKVCPVMDFREMNRYVECHTGDNVIDICEEILRE